MHYLLYSIKRGYNFKKIRLVKRMKKFKIVFLLLVLTLVVLGFFVSKDKNVEVVETKKIVSVSTFFIYDIAKHIAGNTLKIVNILPFGTDPHSFEPTPKLMASIEKSALVIYSGAGLEPWIDAIKFKSKAIDLSKHVKLRELGSDEFEFHAHHDEQCAHSKIDPHYWLDFQNMQIATNVITEEFIKLEPKYKGFYLENRDKYIKMLQKLEKSYKRYLSACKVNTVILNHNAIGYLANKYGFHAESLSGLSPEANPTPDDMKRIFRIIKEHGASTIFFENFVSNKAMQTIAHDAKVKIDFLEPLGNITADEAKENITYEDIMYKNLEKLSKALVCH